MVVKPLPIDAVQREYPGRIGARADQVVVGQLLPVGAVLRCLDVFHADTVLETDGRLVDDDLHRFVEFFEPFVRAGLFAQIVLIILLAASVVSWAVIVRKWRSLNRALKQTRQFLNLFGHRARLGDYETITVASFSAGYAAVRELLEEEASAARIDGVVGIEVRGRIRMHRIEVRATSRKTEYFKQLKDAIAGAQKPDWVEVDADKLVGTVKAMPTRDQMPLELNEQLVVEYYSR